MGTQWESRGKNVGRGLGTKEFPQKKVLSLVLCVAMLLSVMVMGTGAAFTDEDDFSPQYAEAAEVLTNLKVMQGYDDGSFLPQRNITRAQVATLIYRAVTGDVNDTQTGLYTDWDKFDDVQADDWFAGYVNYCANGELIKGFTPDTFGPNKNVTGYQVLAMILRAVGYDQNDEFTGPGWEIRTATTAKELGLLKNVQETTLGQPASRELVAELIFQAMNVPMVQYNLIVKDYVPVKDKETLGEKVFDLAVTDDTDVWGRPATVWYADNGKYGTDKETIYATIEEEALATFTEATSECDIATALDVDKTTHVAYWNNGVVADKDYTINPTVTKDDIGAQGTLIEVYADRIIQIDTYLALVTDVNEATYDDAGHEKTPASSNIQVWGLDKITSGTIDSVAYDDGAYILVNYNQSSDKEVQGFYDVQEAESFVGAQTQIWYNASQHTIDGTTYDDAAHYAKDDADNNTEDFTWFLDQYGNVIGSVAIDRTGYAVLKDIVWNVGTPGYAEATLVYMDGSEATVEVVEFDGITTWGTTAGSWSRWMNDAEPTLEDSTASFPGVSTDTKYNELYEGYALYQVYTYDDGTVKLDGYNVINYDQASMIDTDSHRIVTNTGSIIVDDSTQFLVKNEDNTYTTYTLSTVPSFADSAQIYYTVNEDGIADRVYVKSGIEKAELGDYLYVTTDNYYRIAGTDHYYMSVVIDGVDRTIATTQDVVEYLAANEGKVFAVDWTLNPYLQHYGFVKEARLVNEAVDNTVTSPVTSEGNINYLTGTVTFGNNVIVDGASSYRITSDTVFVGGDAVNKDVYADNGIWVAYSFDGQKNVADVIYIGEKLDESTALTVDSAVDADIVANKDSAGKITGYTVTYAKDVTEDTLTYTASDANSVVNGTDLDNLNPANAELHAFPDSVVSGNASRDVQVWNEAGTDFANYKITLNWYEVSTDDTLASVMIGGSTPSTVTKPTGGNNPTDYTNTPAVELTQKDAINMIVTATSDKSTVLIGSGDTRANAVANLAEREDNTIQIGGSTQRDAQYIVIQVIAEAGNSTYYVYHITAE